MDQGAQGDRDLIVSAATVGCALVILVHSEMDHMLQLLVVPAYDRKLAHLMEISCCSSEWRHERLRTGKRV